MSKLPAALAMLAAARTEDGPNLQRTVENSAKEFPDSVLGKWVAKQFKGQVESGFPADITVERLLSHTAGLDTHGIGTFGREGPTSIETILLGAVGNPGVKPQAAPGTEWDYSGGGFTAAEAMLEAHQGQGSKAFLEKNVLGALGLKKSTYAEASEGMKNLANGCSRGLCDEKPEYTKVKFAGGLLANPDEYARLLLILLNDGRDPENLASQLIPEADVRRLWMPVSHRDSSRKACAAHADCRDSERCYGAKCVRPLIADGNWYGLGVDLIPDRDYNGLPRYFEHGGANDEARCWFEVDREEKDGILIFIAGQDTWKKAGVSYGADHLYADIVKAWNRHY
jgi:CubicO group peptidase (beta-lactamase class C family)